MINPQQPVINLIKMFNNFTALIYIYIYIYCIYIYISSHLRTENDNDATPSMAQAPVSTPPTAGLCGQHLPVLCRLMKTCLSLSEETGQKPFSLA